MIVLVVVALCTALLVMAYWPELRQLPRWLDWRGIFRPNDHLLLAAVTMGWDHGVVYHRQGRARSAEDARQEFAPTLAHPGLARAWEFGFRAGALGQTLPQTLDDARRYLAAWRDVMVF